MGTKTEHWCDLCKAPLKQKLTLKLLLTGFAGREILSMDACEDCTDRVATAADDEAKAIAKEHA